MSSTFTYMPYHQSRKDLRRGKCSDCGNLYLISVYPVTNNYTTEYDMFGKRYYGAWRYSNVRREAIFTPLRSYDCCKARLVPARFSIGDVFRLIA